ncbi:MAG: dTDP-4-dehydrorhamnose reductase [Bacteroidetes bacterium]|jgi:dTDP-4-dehydrorhamnose reductase|nr:dTDP-4-dehydrorhamnose reductase [Bacteroidota bacterium]MBT5531400.1 dTDP-4-dehydrorhamnose reductase [Cytophagia bacterium]MBT3932861.1 dTDP-4-dehydrorhamnose reductase [Bacteroidota bacterium]MBT4340279.1 dTDP-4-dehydrorhamnose reductase [Bacteroidota bacterium]MBT4730040.1 dTDP-4-dehydrorhamnose reductase [Bacteroidota bacterium]
MKVAVIGANGQLGSDIIKEFKLAGDDVSGINHCDVEIYDIDSVNSIFKLIKPDLVVNTAAYHNVEKCEQNALRAYQVNSMGARNLAMACNDQDIYLVHISTDYVFNGNQNVPYLETDLAKPLNVYGNTKLSGEHYIESIAEKYMILRTSGLYGKSPCRAKGGLNFVQLMLKLAKERDEIRVVDDEILTPTNTAELARQIVKIKHPDVYGLAHATAECMCSWYQFAREIFEITGTKINLQVASQDEFPSKVNRPDYSVLENSLLKQYNLNVFNHWETGLKEYLLPE